MIGAAHFTLLRPGLLKLQQMLWIVIWDCDVLEVPKSVQQRVHPCQIRRDVQHAQRLTQKRAPVKSYIRVSLPVVRESGMKGEWTLPFFEGLHFYMSSPRPRPRRALPHPTTKPPSPKTGAMDFHVCLGK